MKSIEFTDSELSFLSNTLNRSLFYLNKSLDTWRKVAKNNPSTECCVTDTEAEISFCTALIEKLTTARGF